MYAAKSFCTSLSWRRHTENTRHSAHSGVCVIRPELVQSKPQTRKIPTSAPAALLCRVTPIAIPSLAMEMSQPRLCCPKGRDYLQVCVCRGRGPQWKPWRHGCSTNTNIRELLPLFVFEMRITTFRENNGFRISLGQSSKVAVCQRIC